MTLRATRPGVRFHARSAAQAERTVTSPRGVCSSRSPLEREPVDPLAPAAGTEACYPRSCNGAAAPFAHYASTSRRPWRPARGAGPLARRPVRARRRARRAPPPGIRNGTWTPRPFLPRAPRWLAHVTTKLKAPCLSRRCK